MKALFITLALAMSTSLMANEVADTTVVYNGRRIVIGGDSLETSVSVYAQDSTQLKKTSETKFVNEQEVERIYVSTPIFPINTNPFYSSMYPTLWWGTTLLSTRIGVDENGTTRDGIHARGGFEVGFTTVEGIFPLNKRGNFICSIAVQCLFNKHYFQNTALLTSDGPHIAFVDRTDAPASKNYMSYASIRMPFVFAWAPMTGMRPDWLDMQIGIALVPQYRFRKASVIFEPEAFGDPIEQKLGINHWGLNIDLDVVFGPIKIGTSMGLLPVFKTSAGQKAYSTSVNIGLNIGELLGKRSQNGSF